MLSQFEHTLQNQPIVIDYQTMRTLTQQATEAYLRGGIPTTDRFGQHHGERGRIRARQLLQYLALSEQNEQGIFSVLLALFGKESTFGIVFGRSSALASLVADKLITGRHEVGTETGYIHDLSSTVFSASSLDLVVRDLDSMRAVATSDQSGFYYFDNTKGVRLLLEMVLAQTPPDQQQAIGQSVRLIKGRLDSEHQTPLHSDLPAIPLATTTPRTKR
jgi:hypothetical protein